jgi:hypothetical protein
MRSEGKKTVVVGTNVPCPYSVNETAPPRGRPWEEAVGPRGLMDPEIGGNLRKKEANLGRQGDQLQMRRKWGEHTWGENTQEHTEGMRRVTHALTWVRWEVGRDVENGSKEFEKG